MSGYYQVNPHYAPVDTSEDDERIERAEMLAGKYFAMATVNQLANYNRACAALKRQNAPRHAWQSVRWEWDCSTADAATLYDRTVEAYLADDGNIPEDILNEWQRLEEAANQLQFGFAAE